MKRILLAILPLILASAAGRAHAQARSDYKIAPHDVIVIDVFGEKDLSREFRVSATGTIHYYFLGELHVAGKTTAQIRELLTEELNRDYLVEPQVTVDVKEYRAREVWVNGQVNKPGAIPLTGELEMDILDALSKAGGFTTRANRGKITFNRPGEPKKTFDFDELSKMEKSKLIKLQPGDIIDVGDKLF